MLSQYANSPKYVSLAEGLARVIDNSSVLNNWYNIFFNIKTAKGVGLDIWGKILNKDRKFVYNGDELYLGGEQTIDGIHFSAEDMDNLYRKILMMTAMGNVGNFSISQINNAVLAVFADEGRCYCLEVMDERGGQVVRTGTMKIRFVFEFYANKLFKAIIESGLMPHPTGVGMEYQYLPFGEYMGFEVDGEDPQPFAPFDIKPFKW